MPVTLRVSSHQSRALGADAVRVFARAGTIGRSPDNDWVLPDPERFVSGQHAIVSFEDGACVLTDCSTNGTIVNGRELPQGARVLLTSGDCMTIGPYEIAVDVADDASAAGGAPARGQPLEAAFQGAASDPLVGSDSVDPLDFFTDAGPPSSARPPPAGAEPDHIPPEAEFFAAPAGHASRPEGETPRAAAAPSADVIPEDWDATGFSMAAGADSSAGVSADDCGDFFAATLPPARGPVPTPGRVPDASLPPAAPASGIVPAHPPSGADDGIDALLRAAGLDPAEVSDETLASLGGILRVVVQGLMDVLHARAELKNQFRVAMTTLKPVENNPLKFSANAEDALFNLFARRGQSFKRPVEAFTEAFDDLKHHQIAMMAGMRAAFASLLQRLDPDELQTVFDRGLKRAAILDVINKTKYWELYREMFAELKDDDATFRRLFGDEFAQAYEEQMQRLAGLNER